jgi:Flp pilus assembly protein TadD
VSFLEDALGVGEPDPGLYALTALLPAEESTRALALLREGRARYPQDTALALAEAELLGKTGDYATAEGVLREAQALDPENPEVANQLALAQAEQGQTEAAAETLRAAAERSPELGSVLERNLAQIYLEAGQNAAAAAVLEPLLAATPTTPGCTPSTASRWGAPGSSAVPSMPSTRR